MKNSQKKNTVWQQLIDGKLNCEEAIKRIVDEEGIVNFSAIDTEVSQRFFKALPTSRNFPPLLPLLLWQNCYYVGSPEILTEEIIQEIQQHHLAKIKIIPIAEKSYRDWYDLYRGQTEQIENKLQKVTKAKLEKAANQVERIQAIIESALQFNASDIHFQPTPEGLKLRYRIDGILWGIATLPLEISRPMITSLKVMAQLDIAEHRIPQDGRIGNQYSLKDKIGEKVSLRVNTLPCLENLEGEFSEKVVLRLLREENPFTDIKSLGFTAETQKIYERWLQEPQGIIIFTGPTGSGKTTTLYTSLSTIAQESVNVITIEDPVEYLLANITQTQINNTVGFTFAEGMRAILHQDPDIILLGEIRDEETAATAIDAALTGHLVLTTLHTNDAVGAIPRFQKLGADPSLISSALLGVVAQRLVRKVCPQCAESYQPTAEDLKGLNLNLEDLDTSNWRKGKGCGQCFYSGYLGRQAIIELLQIDEPLQKMINDLGVRNQKSLIREGNLYSFRNAAIAKLQQGITTLEEIQRVLPRAVLQTSA